MTVALIGLLMWGALASWAVSSPVGSSPDDNYHLPQIYCAAGEAECVVEGPRPQPCFAFEQTVPADCATLARERLPITTGQFESWYPPLYYKFMSIVVGNSVGETVFAIRMLNSALAVALAIGSVALTRRSFKRAVALSWVLPIVPLAVFLLASVNPNAWAIMGIAALWGPLLSFMLEERFDRVSAARVGFVTLTALMALGSRSESPIFVGAVVLAVSAFVVKIPLRDIKRPTALRLSAPLVILALSALFHLLYGQQKLAVAINPAATSTVDQQPIFSTFQIIVNSVWSLAGGIGFPGVPFNTLGWLDTPIPPEAALAVAFAYGGGLLIGLGNLYLRKVFALAVFLGLTLAFLFYLWSQAFYYRWQPRYFLVALFVLVGLALLPKPGTYGKGPTAVQLAFVLSAVALANSLSLLANIARYVVGLQFEIVNGWPLLTTPPARIEDAVTPGWWWFGVPAPWTLWVLGSILFGLGLALIFPVLLRLNRARAPLGTSEDTLMGTPLPDCMWAAGAPEAGAETEVVVTDDITFAEDSKGDQPPDAPPDTQPVSAS